MVSRYRSEEAGREPVLRQVPAVTRAVAILKLLARSEGGLGVQAIARQLGLVPSTCLHILRVLTAEELVAFGQDTKRYVLASGVVAMARGMLRHDPFRNLAQPVVDAIARGHAVTAIGVEVLGLEHIVVVALARQTGALSLQTELGSRYPALISASGRCLAAFGGFAPDDLTRRFRKLRWDNPPTLEEWRSDIDETARLGYAVDEGRYIAGVTVIAAPVMLRGTVANALVVVGVGEQVRRVGHSVLGQELCARAAELTQRLEEVGGSQQQTKISS